MKTKRFLLLAAVLAVLNVAHTAKAQPFVDCSCLATQSVLITNACQAVIPDLCQFTNCFQSTMVPPPTFTCNQNPAAGTPVGPGTWGITVMVFDSLGTVSSCTLAFTVNPPVGGLTMICASNKTVQCGTTWSFDSPTATNTNACCLIASVPGGVIINVFSTVTNGSCPEVITQTWLAQDGCGNHVMCSQKVTVVDTIPPVLNCNCLTNAALNPLPLTVTNCQASIPDLCPVARICATDNCGPLTCTQSPLAGTIVGPGIYPITVTILDCANNSASCAVNFTVVSPVTGPFALLCAPNKTVECGSTWTFNPPTPTNACCSSSGLPNGGVTLISVTTVTNGSCPQVITRTWQAVDACMKDATCSQSVTVVDTTPPVLNCTCLTNSTANPFSVPLTVIACSNPIPALCQAALFCATDNCGPLTCSQSPLAGTIVGPGSYPITVIVRDCASNSASCVVNFTVIAPAGGCAPCVPPPTGMVAWWPLDELNGASLYVDATGNGHTALVESGGPVGNPFSPISWPVGKVAGANYFYGLSPRGRALNTPTLNFNTNNFSVDCWVNPVLTGTIFWHPIVEKLNQPSPTTGFGYAVGLLNQKLVLKAGSGPLNTYTSVGTVNYTVWSFVAVVVNRAANTVTFHINGVTEAPQPLTPAGSFSSTVDLLIGSTFNTGLPLGELAVDELEIFNRTLTIPEMNALWAADSLGKCKTNSCIVSMFCPSDIVTNRSCTQTCATVTYPAPKFTNGVLAGCTPPSGTCFPLGTTTVNCTATNSCGQPATCNFTITVNASTNCQPCDYSLAQRLYSGTALCTVLPTGALEPLWVNTAAPGGPVPMVVVDTNLWPIAGGPWLAPTSDSAWVGPSTSSQGPAGWYTNRWTFNAPCTNVCLRGRFATDDDGYLYINGAFVAGPSGFTAWTPVYVCSGFSAGPNTIELVVHNAGGPTGFRTELEIWTQCCTPCASQTNVWNTGMGGLNGNVPLGASTPDLNYALVSQPPGGCTGPAQVLLPGSLPGVWVPNGPNSQWIGAGPTANCQGGVYHYRLCFHLPCKDGASIVGQWTADDWASMYLNGLPTGNTVPSIQFPGISFAGWHPVRITNGFVCGNNALDFYVTNAWTFPNPTGLRAQLTNLFNNCCTNCNPQPCVCSLTNGDFSLPVPVNGTGGGWTSSGLFAGAGWQASGGNPGGTFLLNNVGDPATDPTISQTICCLTPGQCYTIRGQRKVQAWFGVTAPSFAVLVNGATILTLPVPTIPADTNWYNFSVSFTATNACQTIGFAAEINGTDVSYWIDNLRLECCDPNCVVSIACPTNRVILTCSNSAVAYYAVSASGNTGPVVCTPPSGSAFPQGVNYVLCTATNSCGANASCYFSITVRPPPFRWSCAWIALGIETTPLGTTQLKFRPNLGSSGQDGVAFDNLGSSGQDGVRLDFGPARKFTFTTELDFTAPEGAHVDIALPPDPGNPDGTPLFSFIRKSGPKGYCVKVAKKFVTDPAAQYRSIAVGTNGDLFSSFTLDAANTETNVLLNLYNQPGVTSAVMTVTFDCRTREVSLDFPHCIWTPDAARKGWDGCIYGNRPPGSLRGRLILTPLTTVVSPPITALELRAAGVAELIFEEPSINSVGGRKWGDGHVTLMKAYDDGDSLEFVAVGDGGGVHVDLGDSASFELRLQKFQTNGPVGEELLTRTIGPIGGLTNRPPPPVLDALRLHSTSDGVECSADFTAIDSPTVHVLIYNQGVLVAQRSGVVGQLDQALFTLPSWPTALGKLGGATPCRTGTIKVGTIRLPTGAGFQPASDVVGDEFRVLAELPPGAPHPDYYSGFEFIASEGADWGLSGLQRILACTPAPLAITHVSTGVIVTWSGDGFRLQGAERVTGPWFDLGASSPVVLPSDHPARFLRLICD